MLSRRCFVAFAALIASASIVRAEALDQQTVQSLVEQSYPGTYTWHAVRIASPRKASTGEIEASGLPPGVTVVPVRVDFTVTHGRAGSRDIRQAYFFYRDDYDKWSLQPTADGYNSEHAY